MRATGQLRQRLSHRENDRRGSEGVYRVVVCSFILISYSVPKSFLFHFLLYFLLLLCAVRAPKVQRFISRLFALKPVQLVALAALYPRVSVRVSIRKALLLQLFELLLRLEAFVANALSAVHMPLEWLLAATARAAEKFEKNLALLSIVPGALVVAMCETVVAELLLDLVYFKMLLCGNVRSHLCLF